MGTMVHDPWREILPGDDCYDPVIDGPGGPVLRLTWRQYTALLSVLDRGAEYADGLGYTGRSFDRFKELLQARKNDWERERPQSPAA